MDMDFESRDSLTEQEYLEMIRKKTACLIGTTLRIGAVLAGASTDVADNLYSCGENIGIAFQIRDDILDIFGEKSLTGKQQGGDILRGKKNFLYVSAFNMLREPQRKNFALDYAAVALNGNIESIIDLYKSLNVVDYANQVQQDYFNRAIKCIENIPSLNLSILNSFAQELIKRDH